MRDALDSDICWRSPFFPRWRERQAALIAQWMNVGFIHGVMNTDNMTISGETIDYGPCAFMEAYDPRTVFSSIDHGGALCLRQPAAHRPLEPRRLAEALLPLAPDVQQDGNDAALQAAVERANAVIDAFPGWYADALLAGQRIKLGLTDDDAGDRTLAEAWLALLQNHQVDFTLGWRHLADAAAGDETPLRRQFDDTRGLVAWLGQWRTRCGAAQEGLAARLRQANPLVIPRNHQVEEALAAASADPADLGPFRRLLDAVQHPFSTAPEHAPYAVPAPPALTAGYRTFCGT
jgi:uncharacterized protein YdiU (UPF0061 family)